MHPGYGSDDRETQAMVALCERSGWIDAIEAIKEPWKMLC